MRRARRPQSTTGVDYVLTLGPRRRKRPLSILTRAKVLLCVPARDLCECKTIAWLSPTAHSTDLPQLLLPRNQGAAEDAARGRLEDAAAPRPVPRHPSEQPPLGPAPIPVCLSCCPPAGSGSPSSPAAGDARQGWMWWAGHGEAGTDTGCWEWSGDSAL